MPPRRNAAGAHARLFGIVKDIQKTNAQIDEGAAHARQSGRHSAVSRRETDRPRDTRRHPSPRRARPHSPPSRPRKHEARPDSRHHGRSESSRTPRNDTPYKSPAVSERDTTPPKRKREREENGKADRELNKKRCTSPARNAPTPLPALSATEARSEKAQRKEYNPKSAKSDDLTASRVARDPSFTDTNTTATKDTEPPHETPVPASEQPKKACGRDAVAIISSKQFDAAKQKVAKVSGMPLETTDVIGAKMPTTSTAKPKKGDHDKSISPTEPCVKQGQDKTDVPAKTSSKQHQTPAEPIAKPSSIHDELIQDTAAKSPTPYAPTTNEGVAKVSNAHDQAVNDPQAKASVTRQQGADQDATNTSSSLPSPPSSRGSPPPQKAKRSTSEVQDHEQRPLKKHKPFRMLPVIREELMAREKPAYSFSPTVPNDGGLHAYACYDDDSVPVLQAMAFRYTDLLYKPPLELKVEAILLLERGITPDNLGRAKGVTRKGPVKVIEDCDLYLRKSKLYIATECGLLLVADYLNLAGIPETTKVRFNGVKPAWMKTFLADRHFRRVCETTHDDEPEKVVCYLPLPPGYIGLKEGYFVEVFDVKTSGVGKEIKMLGYGRNVKTGKVGYFDYGEHTVAPDASYKETYVHTDDTGREVQVKWDCIWEPEQRQKLIDAACATPSPIRAPTPVVAPKLVEPPTPVLASTSVAAPSPVTAPSLPPSPPTVSQPQVSTYERCLEDEIDYDDTPFDD